MKTKLTLRIDEGLVRKAKRIAHRRGTSVSQVFGEYIAEQEDEAAAADLPPLTASMLGVMKNSRSTVAGADYQAHLEKKHQ